MAIGSQKIAVLWNLLPETTASTLFNGKTSLASTHMPQLKIASFNSVRFVASQTAICFTTDD